MIPDLNSVTLRGKYDYPRTHWIVRPRRHGKTTALIRAFKDFDGQKQFVVPDRVRGDWVQQVSGIMPTTVHDLNYWNLQGMLFVDDITECPEVWRHLERVHTATVNGVCAETDDAWVHRLEEDHFRLSAAITEFVQEKPHGNLQGANLVAGADSEGFIAIQQGEERILLDPVDARLLMRYLEVATNPTDEEVEEVMTNLKEIVK